jgi:hypothetical protein
MAWDSVVLWVFAFLRAGYRLNFQCLTVDPEAKKGVVIWMVPCRPRLKGSEVIEIH